MPLQAPRFVWFGDRRCGQFLCCRRACCDFGGGILFALRGKSNQNGGLENVDYVYSRDDLRMDNAGTLRMENAEVFR